MIPGDGGATGATKEKADAICCLVNTHEQTKRKRGIALRNETIVPDDSNARELAFCVDVLLMLFCFVRDRKEFCVLIFWPMSNVTTSPCVAGILSQYVQEAIIWPLGTSATRERPQEITSCYGAWRQNKSAMARGKFKI